MTKLKTGSKETNSWNDKYKEMCNECGQKVYTVRDENALMGITCALKKCPKCGKGPRPVIYACDWASAENPRRYPEKYD